MMARFFTSTNIDYIKSNLSIMASANVTPYVSLNDVLLSNTWDLDKTISFMHHWVGTSFYITAAYLTM
uniref:Uncharacterized protein n=1 Tax=Panagrolaimus sp. ES5 TaxID=591445 RepID=A0AC34FR23_9BILA